MFSLSSRDHNIHVNKAFLLIIPPIMSGGIAISFRKGYQGPKFFISNKNWIEQCALCTLFESIPGGVGQRTRKSG